MYVQNYVYMRKGPGTENEIIVTLSKGLAVEVKGAAADGWYEIVWNGQTGYVSEDYLGDTAPSTATTSSTTAATTAAAQ